MERMVAASSHHFSLPFTMKSPSTNKKQTIAPTYTGPEVKGCGPQYVGSLFTNERAWAAP